MFGFGPMGSLFDDEYNPIEPFSRDEFVTHNNRELRNLDAGRDSHDNGWPDDDTDDSDEY